MHVGSKSAGLLVLAVAALVSRASAATVVYQNTTTAVGAGFQFNGAIAAGTNLAANIDLNQLTLAAGSAGDSITSLNFQADNGNTVGVTARPTMYVWAADGAGGGPGTLLATYVLPLQTFGPGVSNVNLSVPGGLTVPSNMVIWAGIGFDNGNGASTITAAELSALGGLTYHPATAGIDGPNSYFIAPGSARTNPTLFAFGTPYGANYGWTVEAIGGGAASQTITFGPLSDVTLGIAPFTLSATASSGLPVSFTSTTPAVCTVSGNKVTIIATGVCSITAGQAGNVAYAAAAPVTRSFTVVAGLQIPGGGGSTAVTLQSGIVNTPYSQSLSVNGGTKPYTWSLLGGALPAGLSLSSSGVVSGVPAQPGTGTFTARVNDSATASTTSIFTISISPQSLTVTTLSPLPGGIVNSSYPPQVLTASGGTPPYMFQATGLPAGITLNNGSISGTPTAAGNFSIPIIVTDSGSPAQTATAQLQIAINATGADLVLSQTGLSFSITNGAAGLPPAARISVESNNPSQPLNYSVSPPAVPWLTVTSGSSTPGAINIALNAQALQLSATAQTSLTVSCVTPSPCAGNTQTINVKVNITTAAPQLSVNSSVLSFASSTATPQPVSQTLGIQNTGGGSITVNSVTAADTYVSITGAPASITAGPPVLLTVTVDASHLSPGFYRSSILVNTSAGSVTVPVTVLVSANAMMTLNPSGIQLQAVNGALPGNPNGSFQVSVNGSAPVNWTATLLPGANWLTLNTASGTSTASKPGTISFTINPAATSLAPQAYYAAIQVDSADVIDSPLTFILVLNVTAATAAPTPFPSPAGLLFIYSGSALSGQTVSVYASAATPQTYQVSTDSTWISSSKTTGQAFSGNPGLDTITVNPGGLSPGVYTGGVSYSMAGAGVRTVNVTLLVENGISSSAARSASAARSVESPRAAGCTPAHLVPTQTGLVNTFSQPAAWPAPLSVLLVDDCGQPVTNARVVAQFSNGDPPLILIPTDIVTGTYTGTWTPRNTAQQVTVTATATAGGFPAASAVISGQVAPNMAPLLTPDGTINAFAIAAEPGLPLAPGTIVQIYGSNLTSQTTPASTIPLPISLNQTSVIIGGIAAPLYYVSPGQINAEVPFELTAGRPYQVLVNANNALSTPAPIQLTADSPGIAQFAAGTIIAQHPDFRLVTEAAPAAPGEVITIYLAGMGLTDHTVASGTASPQANVLDDATLSVDGAPVTNILYAGLTPTVVGLYQVNFQVPSAAPNGDLQLVLKQSSGVSNSTILPVHN